MLDPLSAATVLVSVGSAAAALKRIRFDGVSPSYGPASGNTSITIQVRLHMVPSPAPVDERKASGLTVGLLLRPRLLHSRAPR